MPRDATGNAAPVFIGNDDEQEGDPVTREADQDLALQFNGHCVDFKSCDMVFTRFPSAGIVPLGSGQDERGVIDGNKFLSSPGCARPRGRGGVRARRRDPTLPQERLGPRSMAWRIHSTRQNAALR